ncbi:MAG: hypothetical protein COV44_10605 [Deltaproteobacteria bacterium CG11_big_fil_rev_8_21_14_0_20_45_16]|nr:MAG: hypothetical protein COV44_10605 [Deltaproteobacteria bacterium CG11_big_fil_rev_8_21_14_0_20_45_16]
MRYFQSSPNFRTIDTMATQAHALSYAKDRIHQKDSFLVIGMPGVGVSSFLRSLTLEFSQKDTQQTLYIDLNESRALTEQSFYQHIIDRYNELTQQTLTSITELTSYINENNLHLVIIVDRFEKAVKQLGEEFFDGLRSTIESSGKSVTFICGLDQDLLDIRNYEDIDQFYTLISSFNYYLKPLSKEDSFSFISTLEKERNMSMSDQTKEQLYVLTGGHLRMLKSYILSLDTQEENNEKASVEIASASDSVRFQCQRIYDHLSNEIQTSLLRICGDMKLTMHDKANATRLTARGILTDEGAIFSTRFQEYLMHIITGSQKPLHLDTTTGEIYKDGKRIDTQFSANEYKLLAYLLEQDGRVVNRDEIADAVWGVDPNMGVSDEAIDQLVSRMREKIEDDKTNPTHLTTVRGRGFQLKTQ